MVVRKSTSKEKDEPKYTGDGIDNSHGWGEKGRKNDVAPFPPPPEAAGNVPSGTKMVTPVSVVVGWHLTTNTVDVCLCAEIGKHDVSVTKFSTSLPSIMDKFTGVGNTAWEKDSVNSG